MTDHIMTAVRRAIMAAILTTSASGALPAAAQQPWYTQGTFRPIQRVAVQVRNPLPAARINSPVVIRRADLPMLHDLHELHMTLVDPRGTSNPEPGNQKRALEGAHGQLAESNGHAVLYQFDDLDQDGLWDELFLQTDFAPGETKMFYVYLGMQERGWNPHLTHAAVGSYMRHTVPFWESQNVGWKLWYPTDIDVYGKRKPQLMSNRLYVENLDGYAVSLIDPGLGSDIMSVGNTFGGGGIGLMEDPAHPNVLSRPRFTPTTRNNFNGGPISSPRYAFSVIANGPLRSTVRIKTMNWATAAGRYELEQTYTSYARQDYTTAQVRFTRMEPAAGTQPRFVAGIRKHIGETALVQEGNLVMSAAPETIRNPDDREQVQSDLKVAYAGTALIMPSKDAPLYAFSAAQGGNHVMSLPMNADRTFRYMLVAGWSEGVERKTVPEFTDYVRQSAREYDAPIQFVSATPESRVQP